MGAAPVRAIMNVTGAFAGVAVPGASLWKAKALFVAIHLAGCAFIYYKVRAMGIIPLTSADWVWLLPAKVPAELSAALTPL
jgi:hypothetical protein